MCTLGCADFKHSPRLEILYQLHQRENLRTYLNRMEESTERCICEIYQTGQVLKLRLCSESQIS